MANFSQCATSRLDYTIDWSRWLTPGDTVSGSTWSARSGLTVDSVQFSISETTAFLSGGVIGQSYKVENRIRTTAGRQHCQCITVAVSS